MVFTSITEEDGFPASDIETSHPLDMLDRLILWHIMDDYLEHPGIKGAGQQMAQLRCKAAAGDCVVPGCLNIAHGALVVQFHDPMEKFLICFCLSLCIIFPF